MSFRPEVVPAAAHEQSAEDDARAAGSEEGDALRAADGRVPGRRGRATRQRLLECTAQMLQSGSYRDLKVIDIARDAGTSPATFYQYFADVEAAILVIAEEMAQSGAARLSALVREHPWRGKAAWPTSLGVVEGFMAFWEEHRSLIRVVDLATEEGDPRFRRVRVGLLNELTNALAEVVDGFRKAGRQPADLDPMATAGVLVSMLAHVAAHRYGFEFWGIRSDDLERSMARIVFTTVTGHKPPPDA